MVVLKFRQVAPGSSLTVVRAHVLEAGEPGYFVDETGVRRFAIGDGTRTVGQMETAGETFDVRGGLGVVAGEGAPEAGDGRDGELYFDTVGKALWGPKAGGVWTGTGPISLVGPAGATGATGPIGPTGATGPQGPAGADGVFDPADVPEGSITAPMLNEDALVAAQRISIKLPGSVLATQDIAGQPTDTVAAFGNLADNDMRIRIKAGAAEQRRAYFDWRAINDVNQWLMGVNAAGTFILYDANTPAHRFWAQLLDGTGTQGITYVSSVGTSAVRINDHADNSSGTGGLRVFAGGASPRDEWARFNGNDNLIQCNSAAVGLLLRSSTADATTQTIRVGFRHYTAAEEPVGLFLLESTNGISAINIGGGSGAFNAARETRIYVAPTLTTLTGTLLARFSNRGLVLAEAGAGTQDASSLLELNSTTKGFLFPRMTTAQRDAISTPAAGLVVYNTTTNVLNFYNGSAWGAV